MYSVLFLNWTKPDDSLYWPKHVVFAGYNIYDILTNFCVVDCITLPTLSCIHNWDDAS